MVNGKNNSLVKKIGSPDDVIIAIDDKKKISYFSKAAEALFGYAQDELIGKSMEILLPRYARKGHDKLVQGFANSGVANRSMGDRMAVSGLSKTGEILILDISIRKHENEKTHRYSALCKNLSV